jgi:proline iminopeptidase
MRPLLSLIILVLSASFANGQTLYTAAFGNSKSKPVIFIHGGPGSSSISFEVTTARKLAGNGFYVIVYDRRGEGRSEDKDAKFTFQETLDDLDSIYTKYSLKKATLIGFSFGGIVSTLYAEKYPQKVNSLVLMSSLISLQETYASILSAAREIYLAKSDSDKVKDIAKALLWDKNSIEFRSFCFKCASENAFFSPKNPNELSKELNAKLEMDSSYVKNALYKNEKAGLGFWKNEKYTSMNISSKMNALKTNKEIKIYGMYGKDDGLFSKLKLPLISSTQK